MPSTDPGIPPEARWHGGAGRWQLVLQGAWRDSTAPWPPMPPALQAAECCAVVQLRGEQLLNWDTRLAMQLWSLVAGLRQRGVQVELHELPAGLREVLALAGQEGHLPARQDPPAQAGAPGRPLPVLTGGGALLTLAFVGEVLIAAGRWLRGRSRLRWADVLVLLDQTGPRSLPVLLLSCALVGLMLAYMGGAQLSRIGAQTYLADVVTVGMVRELAGLMTGIILAGRIGSAFAAQLATMEAGGEIDALRVLGVDPVTHLVLPRILALVVVAPALIVLGAVAGVLAGWPAATASYGLSSAEYFHQCVAALTPTHLWIGLFKGMLYVVLVALAGCREGLHAGRSADDVGRATTAAVVKGLVWIVAAASLTTVVFTVLGY